jgi:stearoyl-CoA desaturase (delta-9 desaturase)
MATVEDVPRLQEPEIKNSDTRQSAPTTTKRRPPWEIEGSPSYNWPVIGWLVLIHIAALAAPFVITWQAVVLTFVLHWVTGGIGVCLGFHRLLTHGSFRTYAPVKYLLAFIGGLAGEGGALDWVAAHRKHHALSDKEGDPHSPLDGRWWSHMLWLGRSHYGRKSSEFTSRWAPDLVNDRGMHWLNVLAIPVHFAFGFLLFGIGYAWGGAYFGWSLVVWGVFVRFVFVLHSTWFVNSASHIWGYRNYPTTDNSRNNWWVALLTYGEGWHNNHHAYPRMAKHGHKWWEIDITFLTIRGLQALGLAWNVVDYRRRSEVQRSAG